MTEQQIPALDDLDPVFELPEIFDDRLRSLHEVLVARLRRDLQASLGGAPTTLQVLVCERTAYHYVLIKDKERHAVGGTGGFRHMTESKEYNAFWMNLAEQLNKMMQAGNDQFRQNLLLQVGTLINTVLAEVVPDPEANARARTYVATQLASAGL